LQRRQSLVSKLARIGFQGERDAITHVESEVVARYPDQRFLEKQLTRTSAAMPESNNAYAVVDPTKPVPTLAIRGSRIPGLSCCLGE